MGKLIILLFCLNSNTTKLYAQTKISIGYTNKITIADSLYDKEQYCEAAKFYNRAFTNKENFCFDIHRVRAALSWAKCGKIDSALKQLYFVVYAMNYINFEFLEYEFSKTSLSQNIEFKEIISRCKCQQIQNSKPYDTTLAKLLNNIYYLDQLGRSIPHSNQYKTAYEDSILNEKNIFIIDSIQKIHGWLSNSQVGYNGSLVQFLVVQHSTLQIQKRKLLVIKTAVQNCLLSPENYCLLIDRILITENKKQIYGTQYYFNKSLKKYVPYPYIDKKNIYNRRLKMGLIDIKTYY